MSAKEEMIVEIESAKERVTEAVTEMAGVIQKIAETQETVEAVMGETDDNFAAAKDQLEQATTAAEGLIHMMDQAITEVTAAGQQ